jgi:hypothetical protein
MIGIVSVQVFFCNVNTRGNYLHCITSIQDAAKISKYAEFSWRYCSTCSRWVTGVLKIGLHEYGYTRHQIFLNDVVNVGQNLRASVSIRLLCRETRLSNVT